MNKCKYCKYFKRNNDKYPYNKYGQCKCNKFIYGDSYDRKNESKSDELFYLDYEWYKAFIEVGENFGCIHFKQREGDK